jgi:hypothetical protein
MSFLKYSEYESAIFRDLEYAFCLQHVDDESIVLDVGSCHPRILQELRSRECTVITLDIDHRVFLDRPDYDWTNISCLVASLTDLPFVKGVFDISMCVSTIEHVSEDNDIIGMKEIRRISPKLILVIPYGIADNWEKFNPERERRYDEEFLNRRLLSGWRVKRRAEIRVASDQVEGGWLSEQCFYLVKEVVYR